MTTAEAYFRHEHDEAPVRISSESDVDQLIDDLLSETYEHSAATLYVDGRLNSAGVPDHELLIGINNDTRKTGGLRYMDEAGTFYGAGQTGTGNVLVYYYAGHDREFPLDSELPIEAVRQAAKDFVTGGGHRPAAVNWQPWPEDLA